MERVEYGIQMYSVRDLAKESLKDALKRVAELGYKYIEFAGFFENSAEDVKSWLDEYGLVCSGTHTPVGALADDKIDATIAYHKAIGCDNLIVPNCDGFSREKSDNMINFFNFVQKKLADNGIRMGYHNHSREFFPTPDGVVLEDEIINRTSLELEIDTFWLFNSGLDVIKYLDEHKDRIKVIHLKDGIPSAAVNKNFAHVHDDVKGMSVGSGEAPVEKVREWAIKNNVLMVIESEGLNPTGIEEVERCIKFLRTLD